MGQRCPGPMERFFRYLGNTVVRRRRLVLAVWLVLLGAGLVLPPRLRSVFEREQATEGAGDALAAQKIEREEFGYGGTLFSLILVMRGEGVPAENSEYRAAAASLLDRARGTGDLAGVRSYLDSDDPTLVSADGFTTYAYLDLSTTTFQRGLDAASRIMDSIQGAPKPRWLQAYVTGELAYHSEGIE